MKAFTHESAFAVLVIAAVTALVLVLALTGSGTCW